MFGSISDVVIPQTRQLLAAMDADPASALAIFTRHMGEQYEALLMMGGSADNLSSVKPTLDALRNSGDARLVACAAAMEAYYRNPKAAAAIDAMYAKAPAGPGNVGAASGARAPTLYSPADVKALAAGMNGPNFAIDTKNLTGDGGRWERFTALAERTAVALHQLNDPVLDEARRAVGAMVAAQYDVTSEVIWLAADDAALFGALLRNAYSLVIDLRYGAQLLADGQTDEAHAILGGYTSESLAGMIGQLKDFTTAPGDGTSAPMWVAENRAMVAESLDAGTATSRDNLAALMKRAGVAAE